MCRGRRARDTRILRRMLGRAAVRSNADTRPATAGGARRRVSRRIRGKNRAIASSGANQGMAACALLKGSRPPTPPTTTMSLRRSFSGSLLALAALCGALFASTAHAAEATWATAWMPVISRKRWRSSGWKSRVIKGRAAKRRAMVERMKRRRGGCRQSSGPDGSAGRAQRSRFWPPCWRFCSCWLPPWRFCCSCWLPSRFCSRCWLPPWRC